MQRVRGHFTQQHDEVEVQRGMAAVATQKRCVSDPPKSMGDNLDLSFTQASRRMPPSEQRFC